MDAVQAEQAAEERGGRWKSTDIYAVRGSGFKEAMYIDQDSTGCGHLLRNRRVVQVDVGLHLRDFGDVQECIVSERNGRLTLPVTGSGYLQLTLNWPISMLSSCSRMWQWNGKMPV